MPTINSSSRINYIDYEELVAIVFEVVKRHYEQGPNNPLPDYSKEDHGYILTILDHVRNSDYYPDFIDKASYLFTSICSGHIFSNGNKRLSVVVLIYFLLINNKKLKFENNISTDPIIDLTLFVADNNRNNNATFDEKKEFVKKFLIEHIIPTAD